MGILYSKGKSFTGSVCDTSLSTVSNHPIANSAVATAINQINSDLTELTQGLTTATKATDIKSMIENSLAKGFIPYIKYARGAGSNYIAWLRYHANGNSIFSTGAYAAGTTVYDFSINIASSLVPQAITNGTVSSDTVASDFVLHYRA